ncbi:hypothetical protein M413DRAFT_445291 [Hebeloma cylindrosporum]|uniref:F-box domain-containing protein n=1 Tax=Hebeloma cylindrosporum TaxID=76867 RepID=A0A0C2YJP8_HEBCY|nr:hypothetical protein M413DRAFT_445291 [Hebeloma cylindrosporum h7]
MARGSSRSDAVSDTTATLCGLPIELLLEIIQRLDNPALLNLALTCRRMHPFALDIFFSANHIQDPKSGWLAAYRRPFPQSAVLFLYRSSTKCTITLTYLLIG